MVLVTAAFRRQGLATRLMRGAIDDLVDAGLVPVLDATPAGREVYRKLGFADTWGFARLARPGSAPPAAMDPPADGISVGPITDADWSGLCAYDTAAFGADRSRRAGAPARALAAGGCLWHGAAAAWSDFCSGATAGSLPSSARWSPTMP